MASLLWRISINFRPIILPYILSFAAGLCLLSGSMAQAEPEEFSAPLLAFPVVCDTSTDCFIQHYFDYAPGPEALDHTCGILTYNGHKGIDIRVSSPKWKETGFPVISAAKGKIEIIKDGIADRALNQDEVRAARGLAPRPSNSVVVNHGNGWRTHYGHLRKGSVIVKPGQEVARGSLLGLVGLSGSTSFPHLHFHLSYKGQNIDPFTGMKGNEGCEAAATGRSYWSADANAELGYRNGGVFKVGFSDHSLSFEELDSDHSEFKTYPPGTTEFYFWVNLWGIKLGDQEELQIFKPDGTVFKTVDTAQSSLVFSLKNFRHTSSLPFAPGLYRINYKLRRIGKKNLSEVIINIDSTMEILPQKEIFTSPEN
ncbi:M23 family metallopeptidase [Kiloniella antarctica]|uniref:M23 family metallopeptidase n=1 Tax=Kiloniella antarctica TaxID=1550907 RepID=A0ABW5BQR8_9PROT